MDDAYNEFSKRNAQLERVNLRLRNKLDVIKADNAALLKELRGIGAFAAGHHSQEGAHRWLHALTVDIPDWIRSIFDRPHPGAALLAELAHLRAKAEERRKVLEGLEWSKSRPYQALLNNPCCPRCEHPKQVGHRDGCALAAALREE